MYNKQKQFSTLFVWNTVATCTSMRESPVTKKGVNAVAATCCKRSGPGAAVVRDLDQKIWWHIYL